MIRAFVEGVGIIGPGLDGWTAARPVLAGLAPYEPAPFVPLPIALLPPAERRRAGNAIRLAFAAGTEAIAQSGRDLAGMAMVFTSSSGDTDTLHDILCVLATERREVSPTRFHNSVHNAPAGYWAVATGCREPSTSLCAFDASFAAGLLEAAVQAMVDHRPVTLAAYDLPYPEPLHGVRPIGAMFGAALVLTPKPTARSFSALTVTPEGADADATTMLNAELERLRLGNPAARSLPLLAAIAGGVGSTIRLAAAGEMVIDVGVEPC